MAVVSIPISGNLEAAHIFDKGSTAGLEAKQLNELLTGWNALKPWLAELEATHGSLRAIVSRSNPDDPPDLIFEFDSKSLTVEVTDINPHPYGQAQAIHRDEMPNAFVSFPLLSHLNQTKPEIRRAMTSKVWLPVEDVGDHQSHLLRVTTDQINRKTRMLNAEKVELDFLVLNVHQHLSFDSDTKPLVESLAASRQNRLLHIPDQTMLLIHSEKNCLKFRSFLIDARGQLRTQSKGHE
jgi:hypothetical protein